jgi:protein-L-isoaspartate O-methyltransferase
MSEEIGRTALDQRVLEVMRRVRRHLFVPRRSLRLSPTTIRLCRSASTSLSRSPSSAPS